MINTGDMDRRVNAENSSNFNKAHAKRKEKKKT